MRERFRRLAVPMSAHRCVQRLFVEMNAQQCTAADLSDRSGINKNTLKDWRTRTAPTVDNLEAALNVLGLELHVRERTDH